MKNIVKKVFLTRPYRFSVAIDFLMFFAIFALSSSYPHNTYINILYFIVFGAVFAQTLYFLRFFRRSTFRVKIKTLSTNEQEKVLSKLVEILQKLEFYIFFVLWSLIPILSSFFLITNIKSTNVINGLETIFFIFATSISLGFYFRAVEKVTQNKQFDFVNQEIITLSSLWMFFLGSIYVLSNWWIVHYNLQKSFVLISLVALLNFIFLIFRFGVRKIRDFSVLAISFLGLMILSFIFMKKSYEMDALSFSLTLLLFISMNSLSRYLTKSLNFYLVVLYVLLILGISPLI